MKPPSEDALVDAGAGAGRACWAAWVRHRRRVAMVLGAALLCWGVSVVIGDGPGERRDAGHLEVRNPRVVVLKSKRKLHLFDGDRLVRTYRIGLGLSPVGQKGSRDDNRTPEGAFRVCIRNPESRYHRFLGVSYPDPAAAERALRQGVLSQGEYAEIIEAHANHRCPPWTTGLGGGIGIHGHGADSDWTAGCIALDDDDVDELFRVLRLGDEVEILP